MTRTKLWKVTYLAKVGEHLSHQTFTGTKEACYEMAAKYKQRGHRNILIHDNLGNVKPYKKTRPLTPINVCKEI